MTQPLSFGARQNTGGQEKIWRRLHVRCRQQSANVFERPTVVWTSHLFWTDRVPVPWSPLVRGVVHRAESVVGKRQPASRVFRGKPVREVRVQESFKRPSGVFTRFARHERGLKGHARLWAAPSVVKHNQGINVDHTVEIYFVLL